VRGVQRVQERSSGLAGGREADPTQVGIEVERGGLIPACVLLYLGGSVLWLRGSVFCRSSYRAALIMPDKLR
jgi:hypothetical protein